MAPRRTDPEVGRNRQDRHLGPRVLEELPDTISDQLPNASQQRSNLPRIIESNQLNQSQSQSHSSSSNSSSAPTKKVQRVKDRIRRRANGSQEPPVWMDDGYYEANPWHGRSKKKPIFSLGAPLPHKVRWAKEPVEVPSRPVPRSSEDLAELGEGDFDDADGPNVEKSQSAAGSEYSGPKRTAAGVTHGDRHNAAGQPVFEYQPGEENSARRERTKDTHETNRSNKEDLRNYGIDSEPLGHRENEDAEEGDRNPNEFRNWWARIRAKHPEPLAEFLATGIAVFMGLGSTLAVNLSATQNVKYGTYETSCWAWGFAWMFGIYLGGGVSGAHMNPAISISLSLFRGFPWRSCIMYVVVQFVAGLVAGALAYGIYRDTIIYVDPTMTNTAKAFFSSPQEWVSLGSAFFDQVVGSAIMTIAVFALGDDQNNPPGAGMHALVLGLLVTTLKFTLGYTIGSALNPASDFGPRVVAWAVGYRGPEVFQTGWWFYGPWLATLVGSIIGCAIYDGFIFVGTESPINYRIKGGVKKRTGRLFDFARRK
ncbi:aquaporin-like protein [Daldinia caldariorum]|uniref:aquaporin-like protein n=1 Tax=Daldinia caldariorum TaxID=326644 RepID=UPI0020072FE5|nr:aquaporin-like protein [Daldinia caldariorum]KAI1464087.1 aquaporin-like protein [Daldinia caldariorum]